MEHRTRRRAIRPGWLNRLAPILSWEIKAEAIDDPDDDPAEAVDPGSQASDHLRRETHSRSSDSGRTPRAGAR